MVLLKRSEYHLPTHLYLDVGVSLTYSAIRRCKRLTRELGVEISTAQLIQAHTVFREQAKKYGDQPILVVGGSGDKCRQVAESYGFQKAYTPLDLLAWRPEIWPFRKVGDSHRPYVKSVCRRRKNTFPCSSDDRIY